MGSSVDVKDTKEFCDLVYTELEGMKKKVVSLRAHIAKKYGADSYESKMYDRHLADLSDQLDWKFQILSHACPYDWKGSANYEENVQVEDIGKSDYSPGYLGG